MPTEAAGKDYRMLYKRWESGSPDSVATIRDVHGIEVRLCFCSEDQPLPKVCITNHGWRPLIMW
jgi:hypothetical protein